MTSRRCLLVGWCEQPSAVVLVAQQRGETCARVESRPAEPIDGSVARDERRRLTIADDCVVLDQSAITVLMSS
jgi:hypothetical protein